MECQKCRKGLSKKGSHFLCQGQCQGTFHRSCVKGLAADLKAGKNRIFCNNCEDDAEEDSEIEEQVDQCRDADKILKDIQKNVKVIPGLMKQLESINQTMCLLSDKYDKLLSEHEQSKQKIHKLEKTVETMHNKSIYMEKCNAVLEQKIHEFEQSTRKHNIEIVGIEQTPGENLKDIVNTVGNIIQARSQDIDWVRRNQPRKQGTKTPSIIVAFKTSGTESRDAWLAGRRNLAEVTSDKITGGTDKNKVYINEDLTKMTRTLLWNAKKELRNNYKYIWVTNGKVLVKRNEGDQAKWVRTENDIRELINTKK